MQSTRNAFDEVASTAAGLVPGLQIRTLLGLFNFHGDDVFKPISVLSGGEKSRVILAKLLINPPNFILLDEPTTHLDIDGVEALIKAFKNYEGTLCFISHDLFFIKEVANYIIEIENGELKTYSGGLDYFLDKKRETEETEKQHNLKSKRKTKNKKTSKSKKQEMNAATQEIHRRHKEALARLKEITKEIKLLESEKDELETENYVKARILSEPFKVRNQEMLKEYGKRLKYMQKRTRDIELEINKLVQERDKIKNV